MPLIRMGALFGILMILIHPRMNAEPVRLAAWDFNSDTDGGAMDSISGIRDRVHGNHRYEMKGVSGKCLKLDGFATRVERSSDKIPQMHGAFSVEAWVALQQYPWNWTGIVDCQQNKKAGFFFGLNHQGSLGMGVAVGGQWIECSNTSKDYHSILHTDNWNNGAIHGMIRGDRHVQFSIKGIGDMESKAKIPGEGWSHIAMVYSTSGKFYRLYINGKLDSVMQVRNPVKVVLNSGRIGGWNGGDRNFHGGLDEFMIHSHALGENEIQKLAKGAGSSKPAAWWRFDEKNPSTAKDAAGNHDGEIKGGATYAKGKNGSALELNGSDGFVQIRDLGEFDEITLSAWVRPQIRDRFLPLHAWNHVVGTFDPNCGISLYLNGELVGSKATNGHLDAAPLANLLLGGSHEKLYPINTERQPSKLGSPMLLSGLLDEVAIYDGALNVGEVKHAFFSKRPATPKPLDYELMPTGPLGKGEFGASMEELKYSESWDGNFRMRGPSDVVVKFDEFPFNYVFWHGWNYGLCMVTENGLLMSDQSVERSNKNGCTEHMSDKQNRYAHIRIVENNDARVVLCWRYNPCDIFYNETNLDTTTGWGDWAEEYFYIYPDGVMMREQKFYTKGEVERRRVGGFGGWPSNQETIFFSQPGKGPLDTVDVTALTIANDAGESRSFDWQPNFPDDVGRHPQKPTIQMVNFKAKHRPYMLKLPGALVSAFPPSGHIDRNFPYWNHWPVSQLPNDGRQATRTDRPAHTSLSWFCDPPLKEEGILFTWTYMYGLTAGSAMDLVPLSKSWNSPAALKLNGAAFENIGYDTCQRAYVLDATNSIDTQPLEASLAASESSPIVNPAFVIRGWGDSLPAIKLNGKAIPRDKNCRIGLNHELNGTDLVIWLKHESTEPIKISISNRQISR